MDITSYVSLQRQEVLLVRDYGAYATHATRRLRKLRKKLNLATPKGRKFTTSPAVSAEDVGNNVDFAHLLLLNAERAWAQAMQMKSTHSADPSAKGIVGAARRHIISRLHKACGFARQLVLLLEDRAGSRSGDEDLLESRAYLASLAGALALEKQKWNDCLREYAIARVIYTALGQQNKRDAFKDILSGTVDPSLRYAAYQMKLPRSKPVSLLAVEFFPAEAGLRSEVEKVDSSCLAAEAAGTRRTVDGEVLTLPETINWRSRVVPLEEASISQALAAATAAESSLVAWLATEGKAASAQDTAAAYDQVIIASQDAVDATKTAIESLISEGVDLGDRRMQALQIARTAVNYDLVGWRIGRNRVLCGEQDGLVFGDQTSKSVKSRAGSSDPSDNIGKMLTRLREQVVMYDSALQSVDYILELPGVAADMGFVQELQTKRAYFRALRCLAVGRSHSLLGRSREALALFAKSAELASEAAQSSQPSAGTDGPPRLNVSLEQVQALETTAQHLVAKYRGLITLENLAAARSSQTASQPLVERLHDYAGDCVDLTCLVPYPLKLQPIPVKPLFLDVAWNYIDYPRDDSGASAAGSKDTAEEKKSGRRGWFGFGR